MLKKLEKLAELGTVLDKKGMYDEADVIDDFITSFANSNWEEEEARGDAIFHHTHPKVKDDADHFPINDIDQARNALARVNQYSSAPDWYDGSLEELVNTVVREVGKKYESIDISESAKTPGKG